MEWPTPTKVKEVQSFLGFVNFYRKFIHDISDITRPLYALTRKTQQWVWGSPEQEAFDALKKAITSAPVLTFPSQSGCFCLKCNAVGRIATHILKCSNFANLYLKNTNKTGTSGWTSEGRGFMPSSNKMYYSGHLCKENAIYFSVKKYPHKEMLYSSKRPHLYDSNTLIIKPDR